MSFRALRSRSSSPSPIPLNTKPSRYSTTRRSYLSFFGTAAAAGVLFHLLFFGIGRSEFVQQQVPTAVREWMPLPIKSGYEACSAAPYTDDYATTVGSSASEPALVPKIDDQELLSVEEVGLLVSKTKGYLARDYSLGLGWNNMRYIIESALIQATLLNRTLVLPSFVYARSCEFGIDVCASFTTMVNRGDAIGWGEWRDLPMEKQMGWRVPMSMMLDLPHLRSQYNVILVDEYLRFHNMDTGKEWSNGAWHRNDYLAPNMTIFVVKNEEYDPEGMVRVDSRNAMFMAHKHHHDHSHEHNAAERRTMPEAPGKGQFQNQLKAMLGDELVMDWNKAQVAVADFVNNTRNTEEIEELLWANGWATLHTFSGALGMDYLKSVVQPIRQLTPINRIHGWLDEYSSVTDDILVIEGEIHLNRKPGGMRFTTIKGRDDFARGVVWGLRPTQRVRDLAAKVHDRLLDRMDGRMWMAGHMRRGDFVTTGWAMENTIEAHFQRIKGRLAMGRGVLERIHRERTLKTYDVPDVEVDEKQLLHNPPIPSDPFFLATDERSPEGLKHVRDHGALLISDLITTEDRREFGWGIMLTDVLALVEQSVLARSYYFYAHAMSSVAGGAVNLRAVRGADPRTALVD
ncbi:hypothetical protein FRB96_001793 [Tulasnella sp. 330]|nr:hypothetical protein FRB96_001793 [Tulasnella sp. 330]KAG8875655.1 hypothetical protein FRB97_004839 [Tulasnella sp. 331]KAG8886976.1 hypothetical protein FRB98_000700 [Tulasnella sp. 332]